ncbi:helix-turn-helix domain-containing protein [Streptomyces sp. NPDC048297]|uniref:helix-turn-helix domain-containing protein n=1 Tax=Streptomyces sp. NPDC048297 TaxID=3365531 RepID=UPI003710C0AF
MSDSITPAVPPTPPVPLSALLAREDLALRQIAGPSGPDIVIHWAHTTEMSDPYPYLLGGELLLTAGVHVPGATGPAGAAGRPSGPEGGLGKYFDDYVARIVAAGGAALGFGLAPLHDTVPPALVAACEAHALPLLEVPPRTTFSGVARAVWQLMAQARLAELRRVTEAQQSLASAASRPDPVPSVLRQLAQRLGGRAVLYGPDGTEIAAAGRETTEGVRRTLAELATVVRPPRHAPPPPDRSPDDSPGATPRPATTSVPASRPTTAPVSRPTTASASAPAPAPRPAATSASSPGPASASLPGSATTSTPASASHPASASASRPGPATASAPAPASRPTTGSAPASVSRPATTSPSSPGPASAGRPTTASAPRPASASRPAPTSATDTHGDTHLAAYALGAGEGFVLGVATAQREPGDHTIASVASVLLSLLTGEHQSGTGANRSSALVRLLLGAVPEEVAPLLGGEEERWFVVHARPEGHSPDAVAASALGAALGSPLVDLGPDVVRVLVPAGREPAAQPGWTLGVSAPTGPQEWASADAQAARALTRARATRTALVRRGARPGLDDLVPRADAEAHARALLAPLAAGPALADTLRTWLSLHGSWDRTAVALGVHRNTVRQRIARCAALLDADLDDPDVRMELWFALRGR